MDTKEPKKESVKSIPEPAGQNRRQARTERKPRSKEAELIEGLKMEIASELGLMGQVQSEGWQSLSPRMSGKLGGMLAQKLKKLKRT